MRDESLFSVAHSSAKSPASAPAPEKKSLSQRTGMEETAPFGPTGFPPPFCEVVEKCHSREVDLAYEKRRMISPDFDYSCATAPDLHRFRLSAFPSGGKAPGNLYGIKCIVSGEAKSVKHELQPAAESQKGSTAEPRNRSDKPAFGSAKGWRCNQA